MVCVRSFEIMRSSNYIQNMVLSHLSQYSDGRFLWAGQFSTAVLGGSIDIYVRSILELMPEKVVLWLSQGDGFSRLQGLEDARATIYGFEGTPVIATLCTRLPNHSSPEVMLLPLDDHFFSHGVVPSLNLVLPPWTQRDPSLFWSGRCCGERKRIVERLSESQHAKVGFTDMAPPGSLIRRSWAVPSEFTQYKFVAIIDGNVIASSLMWCFALGAVPILITHPDNKYWCQSQLIAFVNYVPLAWDLSDFDHIMQWLLTHDGECEAIAAAALRLAETVFSSNHQQAYVQAELERVVRT